MTVVGHFTVEAPLGAGGMAHVWRAVHTLQRVPVALKVITDPKADLRALQTEVEAAAGLYHPNIVALFDTGVLERDLDGIGRAGMPWMAMEMATGGTLTTSGEARHWSTLRRSLEDLLSALAHAHARDVIHRDLKPANVLIASEHDLRPGLKLTDFGISSVGFRPEPKQLRGTPRYMAPEQFELDGRRIGPWTDLYALGCMVWELVTHRPAHHGGSTAAYAWSHTQGELQSYEPVIPVPEGLEEWLRRLMDRDPRKRFQCAADARNGLRNLAPDLRLPVTKQPEPPADAVTLDGFLLTETIDPGDLVPSAEHAHINDDREPPASVHPRLPDRWDEGVLPTLPPTLQGVGLGLWGLRAIPLVGRMPEREFLWRELRQCLEEGRPRATLVTGPRGIGKSALLSWLGERATELGAVMTIRVQHHRDTGMAQGIQRAVLRASAAQGLSTSEQHERVHEWLNHLGITDPFTHAAIAELAGMGRGPKVLATADDRYAASHLLLRRMAQQRPLLLWLDDVHWGLDSLRMVSRLMDDRGKLPMFVVMTADELELEQHDALADESQVLLRMPHVSHLGLGPLHHDDIRKLVQQLLGLEETEAAAVARRSSGLPQFAVQLLNQWIAAKQIMPTPAGLSLAPEALHDLPDTIDEVWSQRLDTLVKPEDWPALEAAAALGNVVKLEEWRALLHASGIKRDPKLLGRLVRAGLARRQQQTWSFAHTIVRETITQHARAHQRWVKLHENAAAIVIHLESDDRYDRLVHHLREADRAVPAARAALEATRRHLQRESFLNARARLNDASSLLRAERVPKGSPFWAVHDLLRARVLQGSEQLRAATRLAERVRERAAEAGWIRLEAEASSQLADIARRRGDTLEAEHHFQQSLLRFKVLKDDKGIADTFKSLSRVAVLAGRLDDARYRLEKARERYERLDDQPGLASYYAGVGDIGRVLQDWQGATEAFETSLKLYQEMRDLGGASLARHGLAEICRLSGRLHDAVEGYNRVIAYEEAIGGDANIPRLNLALVHLAAGRAMDARTILERLEPVWLRQGRRGYVGVAQVAQLACAADLQDWVTWDRLVPSAEQRLRDTKLVDLDVARLAEHAADTARKHGKMACARAAYRMAYAQWRELGDEDGMTRTSHQLRRTDA
ncbi:MAG: serine/threonine-protein kinase PknK [Myxococcota bacterium]